MVALINNALLRAMTAVSGLKARLSEEWGQDLIEYALLGGLIAGAMLVAAVLTGFSGALTAMANNIKNCVSFSGTCGHP